MTDYRVQTDVYSGPMELLLYLIKRDEVDLYDIPVSHITKQYLDHVEMLKFIDPNVAGEFLVMASVLMELKSRMLLPRPPVVEGEDEDLTDPRLELVRQLLEYKKFKDASFELQRAAEIHSQRYPRVPAKFLTTEPAEVDLDDVQIWDLVAAFNKVMASIGAGAATHDVVFDDTPISLHAADILDRLEREGGDLRFENIFLGRRKPEMIGLFLALLELMRQARVRVVQEQPSHPIQVKLLSAEPISIGAEWGEAFETAVLGSELTPATVGGDDNVTSQSANDDDASSAESTAGDGVHPSEPMSVSAEAIAFENMEFDEDIDASALAELDAIKTDLDVDAILTEAVSPTGDDDDGSDFDDNKSNQD